MTDRIIVPCRECSTLNRADLARDGGKCAKCGKLLPLKNGVVEARSRDLWRMAKGESHPIVVDFWAPWCGPCIGFAPVFAAAALGFAGRATFVKVNTEEDPGAATFDIRSIPTLVVLQGDREVARQSGAMPRPMFDDWLKRLLDQA